jgi:hypothetical protein
VEAKVGVGDSIWGGSKGRGAGAKSNGWSKDRVPAGAGGGRLLGYITIARARPFGQGDSGGKRLLEGVSNKMGGKAWTADHEVQVERKGGGSTEKGRGQGRGPRQRM